MAKKQQQTKSTSHFSGKTKLRDVSGGSHGEKREREVGQKGNYDSIDDYNTIKDDWSENISYILYVVQSVKDFLEEVNYKY